MTEEKTITGVISAPATAVFKRFNVRVARDIVTYETIELTAQQYAHFKKWYKDISGERFNEQNIDPNYLNDYVLEIDIPTTINKTYSTTEVNYE